MGLGEKITAGILVGSGEGVAVEKATHLSVEEKSPAVKLQRDGNEESFQLQNVQLLDTCFVVQHFAKEYLNRGKRTQIDDGKSSKNDTKRGTLKETRVCNTQSIFSPIVFCIAVYFSRREMRE